MKKYAPGRWMAENILGYPRFDHKPRVVNERGETVLLTGGGNIQEVEANITLAAAAPDLVEALEAMLFEDDGGMAAVQAKAALKKAGVL